MSIPTEQFDQLSHVISNHQSFVVFVPPAPKADILASALALVDSLSQADKQVVVACPEVVFADEGSAEGGAGSSGGGGAAASPNSQAAALQKLERTAQIQTEIGNGELLISFPYQPEAVDKVSYHIDEEGEQFVLVVRPQAGQAPIATDQVKFSYAGVQADVLIMVGVSSLEQLAPFNEDYASIFRDKTTISVNKFAAKFAQINLDAGSAPSLSEFVYELVAELSLPLSAESATNLLAGIEQETASFTSLSVTARTLQVAGLLMQQGARRVNRQVAAGHTTSPDVEVVSSPKKSDNQGFASALAKKPTVKPADKTKNAESQSVSQKKSKQPLRLEPTSPVVRK